jgi:glycosyltransferase involved in cell wall biosynthesis
VTELNAHGQLPGLSLIIPAYNEEAAIGDIVKRAAAVMADCATSWEIIVVSDCSTDTTAEIAAAAGARVIVHPTNKGYGNALKSGISNALYDMVAIIDADGSYPPEDLQILAPFASRFDMVVGQRCGVHFSGGPFKRAGRWLQLFLVEFTTGTKVPDVNSGLRIFPRDIALNFFDTLCGGFSFTTSITLSMLMLGYTIKFVPVAYEVRIGKSHVRYYRDTLRSLQIITHAILKYNPIKAFMTLSFVPLGCMALTAALSLSALLFQHAAAAMWLGLVSVLCLLTAMIIFALGLVATTLFVERPSHILPDRRSR